jgi:hypothetical protein
MRDNNFPGGHNAGPEPCGAGILFDGSTFFRHETAQVLLFA